MKALIQRVREAQVTVNDKPIAQIDKGIVILLGISKKDGAKETERLAERILSYRIFEDDSGRMNRSICDMKGQLLVVSQFTLVADVAKGTRPSFTPAADPNAAEEIYKHFVEKLRSSSLRVETGQFGAKMVVSIHNDGPVTFLLETSG